MWRVSPNNLYQVWIWHKWEPRQMWSDQIRDILAFGFSQIFSRIPAFENVLYSTIPNSEGFVSTKKSHDSCVIRLFEDTEFFNQPLAELRPDSEIIGNCRISKFFYGSFVHHQKWSPHKNFEVRRCKCRRVLYLKCLEIKERAKYHSKSFFIQNFLLPVKNVCFYMTLSKFMKKYPCILELSQKVHFLSNFYFSDCDW